MQASIMGTGRMGQGLVKVLSPVLSELRWGSRSVEKANRLIEEAGYAAYGVSGATVEEALRADIIFLCLWFRDVLPWALEHEEKLAGKIVVDLCNPFTVDFNELTTSWGTSAAEELQKVLPRSYVVGAFKNTFFKVLDQPIHQGLQSDVFVTGDDAKAKKTVIELLQGIPFRILDGGMLSNNRTIERMTLFERELALRYGHYPYTAFRMFGLEDRAVQVREGDKSRFVEPE